MMKKVNTIIFTLMMLTVPLAGCSSDDSTAEVPGCTNADANNYNENSTIDDGSCDYDLDDDGVKDRYEVDGCTDNTANNYMISATDEDGSCDYDLDDDGVLDFNEVLGCTDSNANNHNSDATDEDNTCDYDLDDDGILDTDEILGCMNSTANNYNSYATDDDGSCDYDLDDDGASDWLFIGDSDIEGWDTSQFIDSSNIGYGGSMCSDTLSSIDEVLEQYTPTHVVIVCGENDLSEERTVEETFEDFQAIINKIIGSGASVTYMGTKPEPGTTELHAQYRDYDNRIQDFAVNLANDSYAPLNVVDVSQGFEDIGNPNSLYQEDELHLSLEGYEYWNQWLVQVSNDSECIIWQSQECRVSIE
ncbi:MAG: lysophospholipase L1-like esterase [Candidatus Thalassarchaeaceae archaeon]|jgi:hypothetical protein